MQGGGIVDAYPRERRKMSSDPFIPKSSQTLDPLLMIGRIVSKECIWNLSISLRSSCS